MKDKRRQYTWNVRSMVHSHSPITTPTPTSTTGPGFMIKLAISVGILVLKSKCSVILTHTGSGVVITNRCKSFSLLRPQRRNPSNLG